MTRSQVNATMPGFYVVSRDRTQYRMVMQQILLTENPLTAVFLFDLFLILHIRLPRVTVSPNHLPFSFFFGLFCGS